jgi:hypothetical protein
VPQSYPPAIGTLPPPAPDFGGPTYPPVASWPQGVGPGRQRSRSGNHYALVTFAFVAVYLVLAIVVHFAILGIVPAVYAWRSRQAREPLAPVAIIAAVVSIIVGVGAFVH